MPKPRLIYLGRALPPGVASLFPTIQPASQFTEPNFVHSIEDRYDIKTVGCWWCDVENLDPNPDASVGLENDLCLTEAPPKLLNQYKSLFRLKQTYRKWKMEGWNADIIIVFCFNPVYDAFIRWLRKKPNAPRLVLFLGDSPTLGENIPLMRKLRYFFKPMRWFEHEMIDEYDACVGASMDAEKYFTQKRTPWLWLPPAIDEKRVILNPKWPKVKPVVFGFAGHLGDHSGIIELINVYRNLKKDNILKVAGFGKNCDWVASIAERNPRIEFAGTLPASEPLNFMQNCDIMINPRPDSFGNRYTFPSKILEYSLAARSILSVEMAGIQNLLGPDAFSFDPKNYSTSLSDALNRICTMPRSKIQARGLGIQNRLLETHNWKIHGRKLADFLDHLLFESTD